MSGLVALEPFDTLHRGNPEPRPSIRREFFEQAEALGWKPGLFWSDEWTDEEDGTVYPACWQPHLVKEEFADNHDPWWFTISFEPERLAYPEAWAAFLRLAEMGWEDFVDKQRYPRCAVPFWEWAE